MGEIIAPGPPTSARSTLHSLTIYRGVACLLVVLSHLGGKMGIYFGMPVFGHLFSLGVPQSANFFFVLTGFTLVSAHSRDIDKPERLPRYLYKRFSRIYPLFWLVFVTVLIVESALGVEKVPADPTVIAQAAFLFPIEPMPVLFVAWALPYFLMMYLVFGLMILNRILAVTIVGTLVVLKFADSAVDVIDTPLDAIKASPFIVFGAGALIGIALRQKWSRSAGLVALCAGAVGLAAIIGVAKASLISPQAWPSAQADHWPYAFGIVGSLFVFGLVTLERHGWKPTWKAGLILGDASYPLYLMHAPVMAVICKTAIAFGLVSIVGASFSWVTSLLASLALAFAVYRWVEMPLLIYLRKGQDWIDKLPALQIRSAESRVSQL